MYGGIDQLVDTYKGNPQPLAQKVQRDQQSQPPGRIPPDLEEALALQKITELRNSAQSQQAMQAGGAQPSVVEKLRQMLAGNQAQAQMAQGAPAQQGQPVMAARGGSIDQLMSNLGRHYAGGGIIAFSKPTEENNQSLVKDEYSDEPLGMKDLPKRPNPLAALAKLISEAVARKQTPSMMLEPSEAPSSSPAAPADVGREGRRTSPVAEGVGTNVSPNLIPASARPQPTPPAAPAAPAAPGGPAAPAAATLDPESLRGLTEAYIRGEFKLSPEAERDKAVEFARKTMGLDALLGEKERRANEREALIKRAQGERMPDWVEALAGARKQTRGGLGSLLGQMGDTAQATREAYANQDIKYQVELAQLRDVITDAKIAGNKELVKEGTAAYKEIDARRRAAATNATSLVKTDEDTEMRKEIARGRIAAASAGSGAKLEEAKAKRLQQQQQFLAQEERKWQDTLSRNPDYKKLVDQRSMQERLLYMSTDPKTQEKAQAAVDALNERIAKMMPTAGGGAANIPPPPPGAVRETVKKS